MARRAADVFGRAFVVAVAVVYAGTLLAARMGFQPSADSHYHFSVARDIARGDLVPDPGRDLPFTVLARLRVDHCWGFHVLLAPFTWIGDLEIGMKVATVALFSAVFVALHRFLEARKVAFAWAWALFPAAFSTTDWRYLQLRGGALVVVLGVTLLHVAFFAERPRVRRSLLVAIGWFGLLCYHGAIVLLPIQAGGAIALWLATRRRAPVAELGLTATGMAIGLTINPYMDRAASTWRFARLHIVEMGSDRAHLYDDQQVAEFHGFPARVLLVHPEWAVLLALALGAIAFVAIRAARRRAEDDEVVLAGAALVAIVLTALATRVREQSVPLSILLLAVVSKRSLRADRPVAWPARATVGVFTAAALALHWLDTVELLPRHLATHMYDGSGAVLAANGPSPIFDVAEADYAMLRWQRSDVVCVQGLSRYFLYPDRRLYADVWELHDRAATSPRTAAVLARFYDELGVRLAATHYTHSLAWWAAAHPEAMTPVFRSAETGATLWRIDRAGLALDLARRPD